MRATAALAMLVLTLESARATQMSFGFFEELLAVSDRVLVLRDGAIVAERQATETTEHELILLAGGTAAQRSPAGCRHRGRSNHQGRLE